MAIDQAARDVVVATRTQWKYRTGSVAPVYWCSITYTVGNHAAQARMITADQRGVTGWHAMVTRGLEASIAFTYLRPLSPHRLFLVDHIDNCLHSITARDCVLGSHALCVFTSTTPAGLLPAIESRGHTISRRLSAIGADNKEPSTVSTTRPRQLSILLSHKGNIESTLRQHIAAETSIPTRPSLPPVSSEHSCDCVAIRPASSTIHDLRRHSHDIVSVSRQHDYHTSFPLLLDPASASSLPT
ncbi:hypothetical protein MRB53_039626 [Persea americana]|nr:hypothetical protein MRB53_039626 [Persea americana]